MPSRGVRRHPGAHVVLDVHREMALELLIEFALAAPPSQRSEQSKKPCAETFHEEASRAAIHRSCGRDATSLLWDAHNTMTQLLWLGNRRRSGGRADVGCPREREHGRHPALDRRSFLRNAGLTALAGAVGRPPVPLGATRGAEAGIGTPPADGRFDFDTVYPRFGTDCVKYDQQMRTFGKGSIQVGMGISDMDFRAAPCITKALQARLGHENWGYLDMRRHHAGDGGGVAAWSRRRYGVTIDPATLVFTNGVHPALIFAIQAFRPAAARCCSRPRPTTASTRSRLHRYDRRREPDEVRERPVPGRLRRLRAPDRARYAHVHPLQSAQPDRQLLERRGAHQIGEICLRRRVVVLADEIHCDFVSKGDTGTRRLRACRTGRSSTTASRSTPRARRSTSRRTRWDGSTRPMPDLMARVAPYARADLTTLGIVANHAAYVEGEEWLSQAAAYIDGNLELVASVHPGQDPDNQTDKAAGHFSLLAGCR